MFKLFTRDGIAFRYPGDWSLELEPDDDGWAATFTSPGTAFFVVTLRPDQQTPAQVADEALAVFREEYKELEAEAVATDLDGHPAIGHDIDFLTLDTSIVARTRCLGLAEGNLLLLAQVGEWDRAEYEPVLMGMMQSMTIADDDE